jgi:hypothetical protein
MHVVKITLGTGDSAFRGRVWVKLEANESESRSGLRGRGKNFYFGDSQKEIKILILLRKPCTYIGFRCI